MAGDLYQVRGDQLSVARGAYDPGITPEVNAKIRNLPQVRRYINQMAQLLCTKANANSTDRGFVVIKAGGKSRYRAYVAPDTPESVQDELRDAALLKAALSMSGK